MPQPSENGLTVTLTQSQEVTGTLPYMAPEQLRGEAADARSDVWSAGAVLHEMATGRRPFVQTNSALLINAILNQSPEPASGINPAVPPLLEEVIRKSLSKDPSQRYQTAGSWPSVSNCRHLPARDRCFPLRPGVQDDIWRARLFWLFWRSRSVHIS